MRHLRLIRTRTGAGRVQNQVGPHDGGAKRYAVGVGLIGERVGQKRAGVIIGVETVNDHIRQQRAGGRRGDAILEVIAPDIL